MVKFCPRHRIGFNDEFDAVCPQCTLSGLDAPVPFEVDQGTLEVTIPADATDKRPAHVKTRK